MCNIVISLTDRLSLLRGLPISVNTNGYGTIAAPGNDPYVITVGAMNTKGTASRADDQIASYSSKGPTLFDHIVKPDLVAPGNRIISLYTAALTLNHLYPGNEIRNSLYQTNGNANASSTYYLLSGTSMAAPMVSGAAALLLQKSPTLTPDQVKARLMQSAYKNLIPYSSATDPVSGQTFNSQADIFTVGAGYLDIQAALSDTSLAALSAKSPAAAYDSVSGNFFLVNDPTDVWGSNALWGSTTVWGASRIRGKSVYGERYERTLGKQCSLGQQCVVGQHFHRRLQCVVGQWRAFGKQRSLRGSSTGGTNALTVSIHGDDQ